MNKVYALGIFIICLFVILYIPFAFAEEENKDYPLFGFELEKLLSLLNGIIALILFFITFAAYRTDGRSRFLYISIAFFLFSIKSFLIASELIFPDIDWVDPVSIVLEFFVIAAFFFGVMKQEG